MLSDESLAERCEFEGGRIDLMTDNLIKNHATPEEGKEIIKQSVGMYTPEEVSHLEKVDAL